MDNAGGWAEDIVVPFCHSFFFTTFFHCSFCLTDFLFSIVGYPQSFQDVVCSLMGSCIGQSPGVLPVVPWSTSYPFGLLVSLFGILRGATNPFSPLSCVLEWLPHDPARTACICHSTTPELPPLQPAPLTKPCFLHPIHSNMRIL